LQKAAEEAAACDGVRPQVVIPRPFWPTIALHFSWESGIKKKESLKVLKLSVIKTRLQYRVGEQ